MRYGSVCSGIEAATVAWHPLGWEPAFFSEIDNFPRAVLAHRFPGVPLHGDFTTIRADEYGPIDLLVGGTPCQSFSVAGLRGGLADDRGNLALEYLRLADRTRPRWLVWENVPGVLSSAGGRDFGSILGGLVELGYGFAYRVLDAQFFGVAQRRRRVFVVGCLGDWRRATAVLFERHSLQGHSAPCRKKGQSAPTLPSRRTGGGGLGTDFDCDGGLIASTGDVAHCLNAGGMGRQDYETETLIAHTSEVVGSLSCNTGPNGHDAGNFACNQSVDAGHVLPIAFHPTQDPISSEDGTTHAMGTGSAGGCATVAVATPMAVRRLTPTECERLQGFPDGWTDVPYRGRPAADGPRYKALGNSMAVPCMAWIGRRIAMVDALASEVAA